MHGLDQHTGSARAGIGQPPVNDEGLQAPQASPTCDPLEIMEDMINFNVKGHSCAASRGEQMQASKWQAGKHADAHFGTARAATLSTHAATFDMHGAKKPDMGLYLPDVQHHEDT